MTHVIDIVLLSFMLAVALTTLATRDLVNTAMLLGIFSFLSASLFVVLDAADVAMTEAAVGAGVSTILVLSTLAATGRTVRPGGGRHVLPIIVVTVTAAGLLYGTLDMPRYGDPAAPIHAHPIARHYIEVSPQETGIDNMVASLLAFYRGYDTLGETAVVFTAGIGVLALLGRRRRSDGALYEPSVGPDIVIERHIIVRVVGKLMIPMILLFGCYVQAHGDFGPGGGFQAGVIFASGLMLYMLLFGIDAAERFAPAGALQRFVALGLLIYGGVGIVNLLQGGHYLDYRTLAADPAHGIHYGVLLIELGVGITVASVITTIAYAFTGHLRRGVQAQES